MGRERMALIEKARRKQPIEELRRKAKKAAERAKLWTAEELDVAAVEAEELWRYFNEASHG